MTELNEAAVRNLRHAASLRASNDKEWAAWHSLAVSWLAQGEALAPFAIEVTDAQRRRGYVSLRIDVASLDRALEVLGGQKKQADNESPFPDDPAVIVEIGSPAARGREL